MDRNFNRVSIADRCKMAEDWINDQNTITHERKNDQYRPMEQEDGYIVNRHAMWGDETNPASPSPSTSLSISSYSSTSPPPPVVPKRQTVNQLELLREQNTDDVTVDNGPKVSRSFISLKVDPKAIRSKQNEGCTLIEKVTIAPRMTAQGRTKSVKVLARKPNAKLQTSASSTSPSIDSTFSITNANPNRISSTITPKNVENKRPYSTGLPTPHKAEVSTKKVYFPIVVSQKEEKECTEIQPRYQSTIEHKFPVREKLKYESQTIQIKAQLENVEQPSYCPNPSIEPRDFVDECEVGGMKIFPNFDIRDRQIASKISQESRKKSNPKLKLIWPPPKNIETSEEGNNGLLNVDKPPKDFVSPLSLGHHGRVNSDFLSSNSVTPSDTNIDAVRTPIHELQHKLAGSVKSSAKKIEQLMKERPMKKVEKETGKIEVVETFPYANDNTLRLNDQSPTKCTPTNAIDADFEGLVRHSPLQKLKLVPVPPKQYTKSKEISNDIKVKPIKKVIRISSPEVEEDDRCTHTVVPPSTMMTLAMELHLSEKGKAKQLFQQAKKKADDGNEQETNLPGLWVLQKSDESSGEERVLATHLKPTLNEPVNDVITQSKPQVTEEEIQEDFGALTVEALVGAPDTVFLDDDSDNENAGDLSEKRDYQSISNEVKFETGNYSTKQHIEKENYKDEKTILTELPVNKHAGDEVNAEATCYSKTESTVQNFEVESYDHLPQKSNVYRPPQLPPASLIRHAEATKWIGGEEAGKEIHKSVETVETISKQRHLEENKKTTANVFQLAVNYSKKKKKKSEPPEIDRFEHENDSSLTCVTDLTSSPVTSSPMTSFWESYDSCSNKSYSYYLDDVFDEISWLYSSSDSIVSHSIH